MKINRRRFLAVGLAAAAGTAAPPVVAQAGAAASAENVVLATLLDLSKCIACGACVAACRETNGHKFPQPQKPFPKMYPAKVKVMDWSDRQDVDDRLTPYNWLYIQTATGEYNGKPFELSIPRRCLHCQNPPCANLCPWGAAARDKNGVVRIDAAICLGGAKCKTVCPWEIPMRQTGVGLYLKLLPRYGGNGVMYKCDRCHDRLAQGQKPACIEACPFEVQEIGPRAEMVAKAHALARNLGGYIYGETENGGTNSLYVSPVPFDILDAAVTTGPGKPDLAKAPDMMADETRMAYAALFAPVAGIVAGALRLGSRLAGGEDKKRPPAPPTADGPPDRPADRPAAGSADKPTDTTETRS
jgi:Fe-S-cluster-containing dehydrogenase component